jgi:hypothetical protein
MMVATVSLSARSLAVIGVVEKSRFFDEASTPHPHLGPPTGNGHPSGGFHPCIVGLACPRKRSLL